MLVEYLGFGLTDTDKATLECFNPAFTLIRIFHEIFGVFLVAGTFFSYASHYNFETILIYYSDWAMFLALLVMILGFLVSLISIDIYVRADPSLITNETKIRFRYLLRIKETLVVVLLIQLLLTSISFWASWIPNPWVIYAESYISHAWMLAFVVYYMLWTTLDPSKWAIMISICYTITYYFFVVGRYIILDNWVYPSLDPVQNQYWWGILAAAVFGQMLAFFIFLEINTIKNKLYVMVHSYIQVDLVDMYIDLAPTRLQSIIVEMIISFSLIVVLSLCSFLITSVLNLWYLVNNRFGFTLLLVLDFSSVCMEIILLVCFVVFWTQENAYQTYNIKDKDTHNWIDTTLLIVFTIDVLLLISYLISVVFASDRWYLFIRIGFSACRILVEGVLTYYLGLYKLVKYSGYAKNDRNKSYF